MPSAETGGLIAILDQFAAQIDIFALQFPIGRLHLGAGIEVDVTLPAIQGHQVAGADLAHQPA